MNDDKGDRFAMDSRVRRLAEKMSGAGLPQIAVESFSRSAAFVASNGETLIREADIQPADAVSSYEEISGYKNRGLEVLGQTAVVKLNGGLGTSMGLANAKSLLPVRKNVSFLDLIARQILHQREVHGVELPLILMNSYRTQDDSLAALAAYPELAGSFPLDFLQHKVPRILTETFEPVEWPEDPSLEWCPPGHGDLYIAMASSGMLANLLDEGYRYCFVSNADNLGAVLDPSILGWMASGELPFAMEVAKRTEADKKGGHLAVDAQGGLLLREVAQCSDQDRDAFQNVERHRYFNTNNLWLDLRALDQALRAGGFDLPVICNEKPVSASDPDSPRCYQIETAMGAAISLFPGARAIEVPRTRFAPVKTTNDLLVLWSDAYEVSSDHRLVPSADSGNRNPVVDLDPTHFGMIDDLMQRFSEGAPSLAKCDRWRVRGDHHFGSGVVVEGNVEMINEDVARKTIKAGSVFQS
jgi:UTP--glucose-1-phosphate uridylyltransferase